MNLEEDHKAIRYYSENMTMPGVLTPYNVQEFIYDQDGNAKSFQMSGEIYLIDGTVYSRALAKSLENDTLTIISDELIESSESPEYFTRNLAKVKELTKNTIRNYLKVAHTTDIEVAGKKDDMAITMKNIAFESEKVKEQIKANEIVLEKIIITDKDNELTIQIVTKDYTNKVILTPNYQGKVEKPQLYQKGDTLEYDGSKIREIYKNKN